ncbi:MAG: hypothetical protein LC799_12730, partial [Actinobacteria bacterium]|nr:hypothetical protein [Actinomycetota bacterium]
ENTLEAEVSLDGRTVAAVETPRDESSFPVTAWDTRSGEVITRISGLSRQQGAGFLALNRNGTALVLSWREAPEPSPYTDIQKVALPSERITAWSLPNGTKQDVPDHVDSAWQGLVPLGDSMDGPLALIRTTTVGLVLPRQGQAPPLRRMADAASAAPHLDNGGLMDRLCTLLADPNTDKSVQRLLPPDTSQEPPCRS